jgi:hypothetical protein
MAKIKMSEVESRIVKHTPIKNPNSNKVNLNELIKSGRIRRRKKKKLIEAKFPVKCETYDTEKEITFILTLLRMRVITKTRKGIDIDLGEEQLFLRLNQLNQLRLIVDLLQSDINVTIDGCIEEPKDDNIRSLKVKLAELEKLAELDRVDKEKRLERMMWIRYGNKGTNSPSQKAKEAAEFKKQMEEVRKAKGLIK